MKTITVFQRGFLAKVHPDKFPEFVERGEEYVQLLHDCVCLINTALDVITTEQTKIFSALGKADTGKFPIYTPTAAPPDGWRPKPPASPPPDRSAEADAARRIRAHGHGAVRRSSIRMCP